MQQTFLNISQGTWDVIFWVIRYVAVALFLAYLANVYVKRKNIRTDIKGRVLEWRVETYKTIHRWVMCFQSVMAAPSQYEEHYRKLLSPTKFKIGYQGMEYVSFFDTPERLLQFSVDFNRMMNKEEVLMDYPLKHQLDGFRYWMDDVLRFYGAFVKAEYDKRWNFDEMTIRKHCDLVCRVLGIALQKDVHYFYDKIDEMLRDRLRNIKLSGVYSESRRSKMKKKVVDYCENIMDKEADGCYVRMVEWFYNHILFGYYGSRSQLHKNRLGMMNIFLLVHFEELFVTEPDRMKNHAEFMRLASDYHNCYCKYLMR